MNKSLFLMIGFVLGIAVPVLAQPVPPTLASIEAQIVLLQQCCVKYSSPVMLALPMRVSGIDTVLRTLNLQLSTISAIKQAELTDQAQIKVLQAQVAALQKTPTKP